MNPLKVSPEILGDYFAKLADVKEIVLSTCAGGRVTSRVVSCACCGEEIFFLSWGHHTKCRQIAENPSVALCHRNIQLEGRAEILGSPLDDANKPYVKKFCEKQGALYEGFSRIPGMQLVRVALTSVTSWIKDDKGYCIDHIDLEKRSYERVRPADTYAW